MATELLPGHELSKAEERQVRRKRMRCRLVGHQWHFVAYVSTVPPSYVLECVRCSPHIHSRKTIQSYNLFSMSQEETD